MSLRKLLGKAFILAILQFGALAGVPMTPEQIEKLMNVMHRTKIEFVIQKDDPVP